VNPNSLDAEQKLQKCEGYAKRAISLLEKLEKPAGLSDADFAKAKNEKLSMCHSGLGFVDFQRQKYADAVTEFEQATKLASIPDSVDFYILGLAYQKMKRFDDAVTSFGHCAEKPGPLQERCKAGAEQAKKLASAQPAPTKP
jgi:tetratricopeptide (TPR) repeat protein